MRPAGHRVFIDSGIGGEIAGHKIAIAPRRGDYHAEAIIRHPGQCEMWADT